MPAPVSATLRPLGAVDLAAAHGLSQAVNWPHRLEDWRLMFGLGESVAAVDAAGTVLGVAMWWPFGPEVARLGMVIVSPDLQRFGLGRRMLDALVAAAGARRIGLVATAEGLRLYESFGFVGTGAIAQHNGVLDPAAVAVETGLRLRPATAVDHDVLRSIDRRATGADRAALIDTLVPLSTGLVAERDGTACGYALCRAFGRGRLIGPIVADDERTALALLSRLAVETGGFLRVDIPDDATTMAGWCEAAGMKRVGGGRTMLRGAPAPADPAMRVFGLATQALG